MRWTERRNGELMTTTVIKVHIPKAMVLWMQEQSPGLTQAEAVAWLKTHAHTLAWTDEELVWWPWSEDFATGDEFHPDDETVFYDGPDLILAL